MAVAQGRQTPEADSSPKNKRGRPVKKEEKRKVCFKAKKPESKKTKITVKRTSPDNSSLTLERAKDVQANLAPEFPSLVKYMLHSHVTGGFWLVYIIGSKCPDEVDCALGLLKLETCPKKAETGDINALERETESLELLLEGNPDDNIQKTRSDISVQYGKDSEDIRPEVLDGIKFSDSVIPFEEVRSIDEFDITANGLIINSNLPQYLHGKYYELCCSQKAFLHEHLIDGLNCKLVAGIISETTNIANAIRASKITTPVDDFATWDKTLKAFERLGMKIEFLRDWLDGLINLASESKKYENVKVERDNVKEELGVLEAKVLAVKERMTRLDTEFEALGMNYQEIEVMFRKVATAPW